MNNREKRAWLQRHGRLQTTITLSLVERASWISHGGDRFTTVEDDYIGYLFNAARESLFTRAAMIDNGMLKRC